MCCWGRGLTFPISGEEEARNEARKLCSFPALGLLGFCNFPDETITVRLRQRVTVGLVSPFITVDTTESNS